MEPAPQSISALELPGGGAGLGERLGQRFRMHRSPQWCGHGQLVTVGREPG